MNICSTRSICKAAALALAALTLSASSALASSFSINFCPGDGSCPANVTEASLTFTEDLGTPDLNDYTLQMKITGGAGDPTYIDQISFTIVTADNVTAAGGYEVTPTLTGAPSGIANWAVFYDNVNNGGGCSADTHNSKEVCAQSLAGINSGNGALVNGTNIWTFSVDLADDVAALGVGSVVNLRAAFLTANLKNGGILSPGDGTLRQTDVPTVPEPTSIALLGSGLLMAARARRRRS